MAGSVKLYTLGHSGVIIDQNPLEPGVPDDSFQLAQNMTHTHDDAKGGAVCKRPGLAKFNIVGLGGAILGGIPMPVAGLGGAPATGGGGSTGDATGTGDGTGSMGSTFDGGAATYGSAGASEFGGGSLFGGARLLAIAFRDNTTSNDGVGWWVTSKQMANTANLVTLPGPPGTSNAYDLADSGTWIGKPFAISPDNFCYYVKGSNPASNLARQIRKTNGGTDIVVGTIPLNTEVTSPPTGTQQFTIPWMAYGEDDNIYVCAFDERGASLTGRLMKITSGGLISELVSGAGVRYAGLPSCCTTFEGRVWWGSFQDASDVSADIFVMALDQSLSINDYSPADDQRFSGITCMLNAGGVLYAGTRAKTAGTAQRAVLLIRQPGATIGDANAWNVFDIDADPGNPTPANKNMFVSLVEFQGKIFSSWYNSSTTVSNIYYGTPAVVNNVQLLSDVTLSYNGTAAGDRVGYFLFVDDGVLYAVGQRGATLQSAAKFMWTTDGVTWTNASSNFAHTNVAFAQPIMFGLDQ